jgi:asparagine synthase (glutamine-hydrolysing)
MAFSVESRVPFLDYRVVEYSLAIPAATKLRGGRTKALLRDAMRGLTPSEVLDRDDKMGYSTPAVEWYRSELSKPITDLLLSQTVNERGIFDSRVLQQRLRAHIDGRADHSWQIYRWLSLEQWFRTFIDRRDARLGAVSEKTAR